MIDNKKETNPHLVSYYYRGSDHVTKTANAWIDIFWIDDFFVFVKANYFLFAFR
jgi:hypothetical protein